MSITKYFSFEPLYRSRVFTIEPEDAYVQTAGMDGDIYEGCIFQYAGWFVKPLKSDGFVKHHSDKLIMLIGSNPDDPENLNAEIELWIENDRLVLTQTSIVFVPAGVSYGRMKIRNLKKPVFHYTCHTNTDRYEAIPSEPTAPLGVYAGYRVEKYAPVDGFLPPAPEGFLTRLLWIDDKKLSGAPYLESVWFHTVNDTGPETHTHDFDEIIGFFGGDAEHPEELNAELSFQIGDETLTFTRSCLLYLPRGVPHSPILVPELERSLIHFSGGNGGSYIKEAKR